MISLKADLNIDDNGRFTVNLHDAVNLVLTDSTLSGNIPQVTPPPPTGQITFWGDFESGQITGSGNHNWNHTQLSPSSTIELMNDGKARQGQYYAKVSVVNSGSATTERAELVHMKNANNSIIFENEQSGTIQYQFSVKFDPTWLPMVGNNNGAWGIFMQLHGPDNLGTNPAFALSASDKIIFERRTGDITQNSGNSYELLNGSLNKGHWIDFIITVKYAKENTGTINIKRRDEGQTDFTQILNLINTPTLQYSSNVNGGAVGNHYMKHGLYRNHETFTSVLYLDGFMRIKL